MVERKESPEEMGRRILARIAAARLEVIRCYGLLGDADVIPMTQMSDADLRALTKAAQELGNAANEHAANLRTLGAWQRRYNQKGGA